MVAEYFLNKRSDYKNTTHMMNELTMHLDKTHFPEGHALHKINARKEVPTGYYQGKAKLLCPITDCCRLQRSKDCLRSKQVISQN